MILDFEEVGFLLEHFRKDFIVFFVNKNGISVVNLKEYNTIILNHDKELGKFQYALSFANNDIKEKFYFVRSFFIEEDMVLHTTVESATDELNNLLRLKINEKNCPF